MYPRLSNYMRQFMLCDLLSIQLIKHCLAGLLSNEATDDTTITSF